MVQNGANGTIVGATPSNRYCAARVRRRQRCRDRRYSRRTATPTAVVAIGGRQGCRLRACLRLRWTSAASGGRRGAGGQDGAAVRRRAVVRRPRRLRAHRRVQAGSVGVRGRVVPAGGAAAPVRSGCPARPHGRAQSDGRRAVRYRAQDVRGRPGVPPAVRVPATRGRTGPVCTVLLPQQLSTTGRPQIGRCFLSTLNVRTYLDR